MALPSHYDITVIMFVSFGFQFGGLIFLAVYLSRALRESQRLTRAVAGLVVQEEERTLARFREPR
jgi:hypothetical protein